MNTVKGNSLQNNDGSIMIVALLLLVALSVTVFMASESSLTNSRMMRNNRAYLDNLYRAESGISMAIQENRDTWLDTGSALFDMDAASAVYTENPVQITDENGNPVNVARYEVARLEDYNGDSDVDNKLDADALTRQFYSMAHTAPPSIGSGMSPKNFEMRRYGIMAQAIPRLGFNSLTLISGLSKLFNKSS